MDYDFRNKSGPSYGRPMYGTASASPSPASSHPMYGPPGYPKIGQQSGHGQPFFPPPERNSSFQHNSSPFPSSSSSGLGIKVTLKPEYRITPPPQLLPRVGDIPRSNFQFDFGLERKVLAEAEKENPDWSKFGTENPPPPARFPEPTPSVGVDPVVMKYAGLNREAVNIAVANYGDNPTKVQEFANGFTAIREMGFPTNAVAEALFMFENDTDKALSHLLHGSS
uniref:UBA domain-containing protein n=1 Tax=Noccaea caerulescens TaxID=107243 RepID=A0A1J3FTG7_NOCCA